MFLSVAGNALNSWLLPCPLGFANISVYRVGVANRYKRAVQNDLGAGISSFLSFYLRASHEFAPSLLLMPEWEPAGLYTDRDAGPSFFVFALQNVVLSAR